MLTRRLCIALAAATIAGWGVLVASAIPAVPWVAGMHLSMLAAMAGSVGSVTIVICRRSAPVTVVLEAGRAIGRAEALAECGSPDVIRLGSRRHLRVVDEG